MHTLRVCSHWIPRFVHDWSHRISWDVPISLYTLLLA